MTPGQAVLVRQSWAKVVPIADVAAKMFYHRLFEIDPQLRALFGNADPAEQRRKLVAMLAVAVQGLDNLERLVPAVQDLGRRQAGYGVTDAHYPVVGAALLWTLQQGLGEAWRPDVAAAWAETYELLSGVMRDAARAARQAA
jgi:hemoglobin-like flavoprotein